MPRSDPYLRADLPSGGNLGQPCPDWDAVLAAWRLLRYLLPRETVWSYRPDGKW